MIHVDRSRVEKPAVLDKRGRDQKTETERAIEWYRDHPERKDSFAFQVYRDKAVKAALGDLFYGKCAYCESKYMATQPPDVEHFRPKSAVKLDGELDRPGYYWLAADWDNLLPSCIDCNREREHEFPESVVKVAGKANWFPVAGERVKSPDEDVEAGEQRLLLHPCLDHPEEHLAFLDRGLVRARSEMGEHSIEVFALSRNELIDARRDHWLRVKGQARAVLDWLHTLAQADLPVVREGLAGALGDLFAFAGEDQPYAGLARQVIEGEVARFQEFAEACLGAELRELLETQIEAGDWEREVL